MSATEAARAVIESRITSGAPGSITADKLRTTLLTLTDGIIADRLASLIGVTPASPLAATNLQGLADEIAAALAARALVESPGLTGTPTAPTAATEVSSTQIATTAFVHAVVAALVNSSPDLLNTLDELAAAIGNDENFAVTIADALAAKLALAGGTLTGFLTLHADPTDVLHAVTKQYVDVTLGSFGVADPRARTIADTLGSDFTTTSTAAQIVMTSAEIPRAFDDPLAAGSLEVMLFGSATAERAGVAAGVRVYVEMRTKSAGVWSAYSEISSCIVQESTANSGATLWNTYGSVSQGKSVALADTVTDYQIRVSAQHRHTNSSPSFTVYAGMHLLAWELT